ncbi:MAG: hypothetical protein JWM68_1394 [Verrucomicrobiales bacterium]|nr:hypothetical protein [Verrucomicrobiales bacterium]
MIRIDRLLVDGPADLLEKDSIGQREIAAVKSWIKASRTKETRPEFKAYKAGSVQLALEKLFAGKCAYCESQYTRTQPVDIEHWRPKAEVEVPGKKQNVPGYEWLAADWTNLLPSCIDCNRQRGQTVLRWSVPDKKLIEYEKKQGKGNQFPLIDETKRAKIPEDDLSSEDPLLVNPCTDEPADFFHFRDDAVIVPKTQSPTTAKEKKSYDRALMSIEVYALNRKGLVDERKERLLLVRSRFDLILGLIDLERGLEENAVAIAGKEARSWLDLVKDLREREIDAIKAFMDPKQPYSMMARQFVVEFLKLIAAKG